MADALQYFNKDNLSFFPHEIQTKVTQAAKLFGYEINEEHKQHSTTILNSLKHHDIPKIQESILAAASCPSCLEKIKEIESEEPVKISKEQTAGGIKDEL
jgi:orotidine-5'-phosphate decarboxylase